MSGNCDTQRCAIVELLDVSLENGVKHPFLTPKKYDTICSKGFPRDVASSKKSFGFTTTAKNNENASLIVSLQQFSDFTSVIPFVCQSVCA